MGLLTQAPKGTQRSAAKAKLQMAGCRRRYAQ